MRKLLTAVSLAVMLALGAASISSQALADEVVEIHLVHMEIHKDDSWTEVWEDKDGGLYFFDYDKDGNRKGNPNPEGGSSSTQSSQDLKDVIKQALEKGGGSVFNVRPDFYDTPFGKALVETGKTGSIIPYHNPADSLTQDFDGGYGSGKGGIDLNGGSIVEQIKKHGSKKKDDDDDDGDGTGNPGTGDDDLQFGGASADMELVNPVPEPVKKPAAKAANRGLPAALTRRSILGGGPSLLPAGPSAIGTPLVSAVGSPLGSSLR